MAARIRKIRCDEETRNRIKTTQLVKRLTDHALGNVDMPATAVTAAIALIRKTLPDLAATEHSGNVTLSHEDALNELDDTPGTADTPDTPA